MTQRGMIKTWTMLYSLCTHFHTNASLDQQICISDERKKQLFFLKYIDSQISHGSRSTVTVMSVMAAEVQLARPVIAAEVQLVHQSWQLKYS